MSKKIIIDSGHGGKDSGGGSNESWLEKDFNLKMSLEQKRLFEKLGVEVYLTRSNDKYLSSVTRTNIVKNSGANYCISNHVNSYTSSSAKGVEVAHSIHAKDTWAMEVFDAVVNEGAYPRRVFTKKIDDKTDFYFMHRETGSVQTIIVEYGFATNSEDIEKLIKDWNKYARGVVISTCKYWGIDYSELLNSKEEPENEYYLKVGMKGPKVKELQENLIELGFSSYMKPFGADSIFGKATRDTVIAFQRKYDLEVDGIAGVETLGKIERLLKPQNFNRVVVNGKQVAAYLILQNAVERYEEEVKKAKKGDKIEIYYIGE